MDQQTSTFYELRFRTQFLESKATAFQDLFVAVMSKAHPSDFLPCRPWGSVGDRKNDGYLKSERTLFQVYAPNEMKLADTISKIVTDFTVALPYWQRYFDTWIFVHNAHGGLPPDVIAKLLELEQLNASLKITHWGYEELLLRFRLLTPEALRSLYGDPPPSAEPKKQSEARRKLKLAQEIVRGGKKHSEAIQELTEALAIARNERNEEDEVEILINISMLCSNRHGRGDQQHYFRQAEMKVDKIRCAALKVMYFRARASVLEKARDFSGAEAAYREALRCCAEPDDEKGNLSVQACAARASFAHFLCEEKRPDEARAILGECEAYARKNKESEDGELLELALSAGIHFAFEIGDEDGVVQRIHELEESATTSRVADRIGGELVNIANRLSHRKAHRAALAAAEASVRLGRRAYESSPNFLVGALYTEAMVIMQAGDDETALNKAEAILDLCNDAEDDAIKYAVQHLISEIQRASGDSQTAVELARKAFSLAKGRPEEMSFAKCALARALNDNGQTEEALKHVKEAWTLAQGAEIPPEGSVEILSQITHYASQLGAEEDVAEAAVALQKIPEKSEDVKTSKERAVARANANKQLRRRLLQVFDDSKPAKTAGTEKCASLPEANAIVARSLLRFWDDVGDIRDECIASVYDFWGRGNFERMLLNAQCFPNSFNVTLEVRSLDDVKRAVRIWGLYTDFLILLWKGPTQSGQVIIPFPEDYDEPGGWGYIIAAGTILKKEGSKKKWYPAMAHISAIPADVAAFLATEGRPFIQSGRLVVVPAVGVGCVNPGHGPFEQLLAESANAIPSIRWKGVEGTPIGYVPHSPDAPFELLAELAEVESERLRKLRLLLLRRSRQLRPDGEIGREAKILSLEIDDALRDLEDRNTATTRKRGLHNAREPLAGATARFKSGGGRLGEPAIDSPFAPLLVLQSAGYGWRVDSPQVPTFPARFEPKEGDVIGTWLAPPSVGWAYLAVRPVDD